MSSTFWAVTHPLPRTERTSIPHLKEDRLGFPMTPNALIFFGEITLFSSQSTSKPEAPRTRCGKSILVISVILAIGGDHIPICWRRSQEIRYTVARNLCLALPGSCLAKHTNLFFFPVLILCAEKGGKARGVVTFFMETLMLNHIAKRGTSAGRGFDSRDTPRDPGTLVSVENIFES